MTNFLVCVRIRTFFLEPTQFGRSRLQDLGLPDPQYCKVGTDFVLRRQGHTRTDLFSINQM